jgi:eukaryotic-like serine/threonine-protein kinase
MALTPGSRLGVYEVTAQIGVGGMGEVYRAMDTKLKRQVAIKILLSSLAADPDRLARFQREAEVLASLNHPHIAAIYGLEDADGVKALVMELVEGDDLSQRIALGAIPLDEALPIAKEIAEALEAAHEQGIIHRDLKPANVKVRPDGTVKVLDFGLAKAIEPVSGAGADVTAAPTITSPAMTQMGVILGTAAYMSPEQAKGRVADKRSDVWAFGCVLYEMLTGKRAFAGDDVSDTLAAVLRGEPDWSALPTNTPAAIRRQLRRALTKDRKNRPSDMAGARLDIQDAIAKPDVEITAARAVAFGLSRERIAWSIAAFLLAVLVALVTLFLRRAPVETRTYRTSILPPENILTWSRALPPLRFVLSPDGRRLAFVATGRDGRSLLWVRSLDSLVAQPLAGTDDAQAPFWSPNGRFIAFVAQGKLMKIDVTGGPPIALADAVPGNASGAWGGNDVILFVAKPNAGLFQISGSGGTPIPVTTLDSAVGETRHWWPSFLPDGQHFLYEVVGSTRGGGTDPQAVRVGSLNPNETSRPLLQGGSNAKYAQGHVLFMRGRTLMAQPLDVARLELTGEPIPIAEQIQIGGATSTSGAFSVSEAGLLAYQTGEEQGPSQLIWFDRSGKQVGVVADRANNGDLKLSPDGTLATVSRRTEGPTVSDIWIIDLVRGLPSRFTFEVGNEYASVWSSDNSRIIFNWNTKGSYDLYLKASSGAGSAELVLADSRNKSPYSWSPDGRFILFGDGGGEGSDLWILPLSGERNPIRFMQTPYTERDGSFSPDGRWIAFVSNESGRAEVYAAPFPATGAKTRVSAGGGEAPRWRRDERELFFRAPDDTIMVAEVDGRGPEMKVGSVNALFRTRPVIGQRDSYDVSADGQRFLVNTLVEEGTPAPITLLVS